MVGRLSVAALFEAGTETGPTSCCTVVRLANAASAFIGGRCAIARSPLCRTMSVAGVRGRGLGIRKERSIASLVRSLRSFNHPASRDSFDRSAHVELVRDAGAGDRSPDSCLLAPSAFPLAPYALRLTQVVVVRLLRGEGTGSGGAPASRGVKRWLQVRLAFLSRNPSGTDHPVFTCSSA